MAAKKLGNVTPLSREPSDRNGPTSKKPKWKYTGHIDLGKNGQSLDGRLYQEVCFPSHGKMVHRMIPLAGLTANSEELVALTDDGAHLIVPAARSELLDRMQAEEPRLPKYVVATRLGLINGNFVLPGYKIGPTKHLIRVCLPAGRGERFSRYRLGGSRKQWRRLAKRCRGNTRMMLLMAIALSGAVAGLLGVEQISAMLVGAGESFKSTAQMAAGSVWGCHVDPVMADRLGFTMPFRATDNDLEYEFLASCHTLTSFDETRSTAVTERKVSEFIIGLVMQLDSGFEKGRMGPKTRQAAAAPIIMSSNWSLERMGAAAGREIDESLHGRLISVPLPESSHGVFENLHGEQSAADFGTLIRNLAKTNHGHASRQFLKALIGENTRDPEALRAWLQAKRSNYLKYANKIDARGRAIKRINEKLATVYAAARFAIEHKVLPWSYGELRESLLTCTRDHISLVEQERAILANAAPSRPSNCAKRSGAFLVAELREYIREHRDELLDSNANGVADRLSGARAEWPVLKSQHQKNGTEYLITFERLLAMFNGDAQVKTLQAALKVAGHIVFEARSDGFVNYSLKRPVRGMEKRPQFIVIKAAAVEGDA